MRVLFDTNIVLDVLLNRQPRVKEAALLWKANEDGRITAYLAASSLTDIFYVARRLTDLATARQAVRLCLASFEICPVDRNVLSYAEALPGSDFEDNLQLACATIADLDIIVTRDSSGFTGASLAVLTPANLLAQLG